LVTVFIDVLPADGIQALSIDLSGSDSAAFGGSNFFYCLGNGTTTGKIL